MRRVVRLNNAHKMATNRTGPLVTISSLLHFIGSGLVSLYRSKYVVAGLQPAPLTHCKRGLKGMLPKRNERHSPPFSRRGGRDVQTMSRSHHVRSGRGWFSTNREA